MKGVNAARDRVRISSRAGVPVPGFRQEGQRAKIMEVDVDGPLWRDDLFTEVPQIKDGHLLLPQKPGFGTALNEKEVAKHPWPSETASKLRMEPGMAKSLGLKK